MKNIKIAISGCGRTGGLASHLAKESGITIKGAFDPKPCYVDKMFDRLGFKGLSYDSYEDMVADPDIDWILVGSPNCFHRQQIVSAFQAGKHDFSEKPLATSIEDCKAIVDAQAKTKKNLAIGLCMCFSPPHRSARDLLSSGKLGSIVSIDANENINPGHGAYIMSNWRRNKDLAGAHILEKCVHDLDLLNWIIGSIPHRIAAFGGNNMFIPKNSHILNKSKSFRRLETEWEPGVDPFTVPKTIEDNIVAILEYYNGVRVQFQATMCNIMPERRMYFHCTQGNCIVEQYSATLKYQAIDETESHLVQFAEFHDAHLEGYQKVHADGDEVMIKNLACTMRDGTPFLCGAREGMLGSVVGIMIDHARLTGQVLDLTDTWKSLGIAPRRGTQK
jgi:predicted dehydrogenase